MGSLNSEANPNIPAGGASSRLWCCWWHELLRLGRLKTLFQPFQYELAALREMLSESTIVTAEKQEQSGLSPLVRTEVLTEELVGQAKAQLPVPIHLVCLGMDKMAT